MHQLCGIFVHIRERGDEFDEATITENVSNKRNGAHFQQKDGARNGN